QDQMRVRRRVGDVEDLPGEDGKISAFHVVKDRLVIVVPVTEAGGANFPALVGERKLPPASGRRPDASEKPPAVPELDDGNKRDLDAAEVLRARSAAQARAGGPASRILRIEGRIEDG